MLEITDLFKMLAEREGSDLHLTVGSPPVIRLDGALFRTDLPALTGEDTVRMAQQITPADRQELLSSHRELDFAYSLSGVGRFRINVFRQRGSVTIVARRVRIGSASFDELGLPPVIRDLASQPRGLVLVTGPTGSGKTTTLAAMIDHINSTKPVHILTIEDPIEVLHPHKRATVNQRELGVDTERYLDAMRAAMRQDPDVIFIGEMRDMETVGAALAASETGHLVLSTLHTTDAVETVNRIVDFFPPFQQHQIRVTLASVLRGVVCQRLLPRVGGGRVAVCEVLVNNGRVADRIVDLVQRGLVDVQEAMEASDNPHDLGLMLEQIGLRAPMPVGR